jgi:hypothetical protein
MKFRTLGKIIVKKGIIPLLYYDAALNFTAIIYYWTTHSTQAIHAMKVSQIYSY